MNKYYAKKATWGTETFDSIAERDYYLILLSRLQKGEILSLRRQPKYVLLEGFTKQGKTYRPIVYTADFEVTHRNGCVEVIDVKSTVTETEAFSIRLRLFEAKYPELRLVRIRNVPKFGGWITHEEYLRKKKEERKAERRVAERAVNHARRRY